MLFVLFVLSGLLELDIFLVGFPLVVEVMLLLLLLLLILLLLLFASSILLNAKLKLDW